MQISFLYETCLDCMYLPLEHLIQVITLKYFMLFSGFDAIANITAHFVKFVHRRIIVDDFIE